MIESLHFLAHYGYWLLIAAVLGRQACLPIPANLLLVAAGALAHSGQLRVSWTVGLSVMAFLMADLAWYEVGRRYGERALHFLCGLSHDPETSVHKATSAFAAHGVRTLLFSKFVIGLDAVAVPLTGAARVPRARFLIFDALGAIFWSATYTALGYIFSNQLDRVASHLAGMGTVVLVAAAAAVSFHLGRKFARWQRFVRQFKLARITPEQLKDKLNGGENILIVDLQGRMGHAAEPMAIPGAVRINPRRLEQYKDVEISPSQEVVLYCASPSEFTSARVALALREKGVLHVRPLAGGLQAWCDCGFPTTSEVRVLQTPVATS